MQTKSTLTALTVSTLMLVVSNGLTAASWYEEYDLTSLSMEETVNLVYNGTRFDWIVAHRTIKLAAVHMLVETGGGDPQRSYVERLVTCIDDEEINSAPLIIKELYEESASFGTYVIQNMLFCSGLVGQLPDEESESRNSRHTE